MTQPNWRMRFVNGAARTQNTRAEQEEAEFMTFMEKVVRPAFSQIGRQLTEKGRTISSQETRASCSITVRNGNTEEISFRVMRQSLPNSVIPSIEAKMRERLGMRIRKKSGPLRNAADLIPSLSEATPDDIVNAFYKYYAEALGNIG